MTVRRPRSFDTRSTPEKENEANQQFKESPAVSLTFFAKNLETGVNFRSGACSKTASVNLSLFTLPASTPWAGPASPKPELVAP